MKSSKIPAFARLRKNVLRRDEHAVVDDVAKLVLRVDHPLHQRSMMGSAESSDPFKDDNWRPPLAHEVQGRDNEISSASDISPPLLQAKRREMLARKAGDQDVAVGTSRRVATHHGPAWGLFWMVRSKKSQGACVDLPTNLRAQAMIVSHSTSRHVGSSNIAD